MIRTQNQLPRLPKPWRLPVAEGLRWIGWTDENWKSQLVVLADLMIRHSMV